MGQILSQEEVDALLKGVVAGEIETETAIPVENESGESQLYDFFTQDKVIRGRMPSLDAINDRFSRFFKNTLSNMLRRIVDVTPISLDSLKFGNFMRSLAVPTSIHIINIEPLRGNALVVLETKLVFALVDCFFGGRGYGGMKIEGREFTSIEQRMLTKVVDAAIKELEKAWKPVYELHFSYVRGEMNPQFAGIIPNDDVLIVMQFDVDMDDLSGNIMVCIPYMLIDPIRDRLYASFSSNEKVKIDDVWLNRFKHELMNVAVDLTIDLGNTSFSPRELSSLKPGDVLVLDTDVNDVLQIKVQGLPKFFGKPGRSKDNLAIEIVEALET